MAYVWIVIEMRKQRWLTCPQTQTVGASKYTDRNESEP